METLLGSGGGCDDFPEWVEPALFRQNDRGIGGSSGYSSRTRPEPNWVTEIPGPRELLRLIAASLPLAHIGPRKRSYLMPDNISKTEHLLALSDEILADLENEILSFEKVLSKCKRLASMQDDFEVLDWLTLELHGYAESDLPPGIKREDLYKFAVRSGRGTVEKTPTTQQFENKY
jgi:hypothetical protein